ncbi:hypothetical protein [Pedobacter sp. SYP-B3415]|uniref:hypothetical protein n=1 Tax=Pedobacter sp. SYP-B3415 TaxID=2496641 RepID=UPI00101CC38F|nr:hypothetical protein [Pedobacter sp. SYP-B3415]
MIEPFKIQLAVTASSTVEADVVPTGQDSFELRVQDKLVAKLHRDTDGWKYLKEGKEPVEDCALVVKQVEQHLVHHTGD